MKPEIRIFFEIVGIWLVCILPGIGLGRFLADQGVVKRDLSVLFSLSTFLYVLIVRMSVKTSATWWSETWWFYILMTIMAFLITYRYGYEDSRYWGRRKAKPLNPRLKNSLILAVILSLMGSLIAFIWSLIAAFR